MPTFTIPPLSDTQKGIIIFVSGILILFYAFGFFSKLLNVIVICGGFGMMVYGFVKAGGIARIQKFRKKDVEKY